MTDRIFSLVSEERFKDILGNFQQFTGLAIQLINSSGNLILSFGEPAAYCSIMQKQVFVQNECFKLHMEAGQRAQVLGEAYIFSCHANLNHIAFPLIHQGELLGSVILGPFLINQPDSTLVNDVADRYHLSTAMALDLYDELGTLTVFSPAKVQQLKKLVDHLLSLLMPGERALLLQNQEKMSQQARINENIQAYKTQAGEHSPAYFHSKETELLAKVRAGNVTEVKALLNELIGYVLFTEGGHLDFIRARSLELTTLLSRVAIDGGAKTESIYDMNTQFLSRLYREQNLDNLCMLIQEILECFMRTMFNEKDKGNPYIRKALRYMSDHYAEHLELNDVADYVQISPGYLSALFPQVVGISFREQLCRLRVEESKRLLLARESSIAEIAVAVGFPDQSYYSKVFKRIVGVTPKKFQGS